jgi:hypothetical protein
MLIRRRVRENKWGYMQEKKAFAVKIFFGIPHAEARGRGGRRVVV